MIILGLSGKKQTGKNTVATLLQQVTKKWCIEVAFGQFVKNEVAVVCGTTVDNINKNKELFRPILQWWGTEFRRASDNDYWIRKMDELLVQLTKDDRVTVVIVTDVRFQNEYNYLKKIDGVLIRVARPLDIIDNHPSEIDLDKEHNWDDIILNTGTIEELKLQVGELITKYKL